MELRERAEESQQQAQEVSDDVDHMLQCLQEWKVIYVLYYYSTAATQQHSHHVCVHVGVGVGVPGCASRNASFRSCIHTSVWCMYVRVS